MTPVFERKFWRELEILPRLALVLLIFVLAHSVWQTASAVAAGKSFQESIPVLEKPIADFGKWVGGTLTAWIPEIQIPLSFGEIALKKTAAYAIYEWVKLPIILFLTTFGMTLLRLKAGAKRIEKTLGRDDFLGAVGGTITGMLTPVCSCTVTNLYAGLVAGGASQKASSAFLFASPALNEFAIIFMFAFGGLQGGLIYLTAGFFVSILTAYLSPWLGLTPQNFVDKIAGLTCHHDHHRHSGVIAHAYADSVVMLKRLLVPILLSGFLAAILVNFNLGLIEAMQSVQFNWWGPLAATALGLPLDINAASTAPILMGLSVVVPLGTLVSLMMATTVSSIPEVSMLKPLLGSAATVKLVAWYGLYTALIGLLINFIFV